ncbi:hypothetical protein IGI04_039835 [Brassica rapa subsp. trilocularis]|uniref:Uncharacterized protein n=1 Tax=Brassica rapa subsp. trilocularis TaxID=1813537 RepID=A0ABQ7KPP2_BRACM|nr:hypothetical protein IGI04_039835 [Brassica rapa subsp. trilocularis]
MHHILTQFSGHTLFDNNSACHLLPDVKLISGHLYYLVPTTTKKKMTKKVMFVDPEIVVSKQELEKLPQGWSFHEMVYQTLEKQTLLSDDDNLQCKTKKVMFADPEVEEDARLLREGVADHTGERTSNTDGDDNKNVSVMRIKSF